jgi:hypothetical protein
MASVNAIKIAYGQGTSGRNAWVIETAKYLHGGVL